MTRTLAAVASAILLCALTAVAAGQTDEELRQLYVRRDFGQMKQIARSGDARALTWMGLIKRQEGEREKAKEWYRRAAVKDHPRAISELAEMHRVDGETEQALYWYRRGAENGNAADQVTLAWLLRKGSRGVPLDPHEAYRWYAAAAAQRYDAAYLALAELKADGFGTERSRIEAYAFAEIAETVRGDSSETTAMQAKALKEQLAAELWPHEIAQAVRRARELRPELDEIKAKQKRDDSCFRSSSSGFSSLPSPFSGSWCGSFGDSSHGDSASPLRTADVVECPAWAPAVLRWTVSPLRECKIPC